MMAACHTSSLTFQQVTYKIEGCLPIECRLGAAVTGCGIGASAAKRLLSFRGE